MATKSLPASREPGWQPCGPALLARVAAVALAAGWLAYEWQRWPNGTALLGPLGLVWYNGPTAGNLACCAVGLALVLGYLVRPGC
jgi:hypothetical protein